MITFYKTVSNDFIAIHNSKFGFTRVITSCAGSDSYTEHCDGKSSVSYYPVPDFRVDWDFFKEWVSCLVDDMEA